MFSVSGSTVNPGKLLISSMALVAFLRSLSVTMYVSTLLFVDEVEAVTVTSLRFKCLGLSLIRRSPLSADVFRLITAGSNNSRLHIDIDMRASIDFLF